MEETLKKSKPKTIFIEARKKLPEKLELSALDKLPGKTVSLAATIQYLDFISQIKKYLEKLNKKVTIKKGAYHTAHVLGCNTNAFDKQADTQLLIADGKFHAINNAIQLQKPLHIFNPQKNKIEKISKQEIEKQNKKIQAKQSKFFTAKNIGLLISVKSGQKISQKQIKKIKQQLQDKDKNVYLFTADNINPQEFENFPQIEIWLNTACPGLSLDDNRILNYRDISEFLN